MPPISASNSHAAPPSFDGSGWVGVGDGDGSSVGRGVGLRVEVLVGIGDITAQVEIPLSPAAVAQKPLH